ncbi:TMV resistance protein N [Spatholobus suberectus]|nr:TMV resistance protein N [Spatholobus suberectus]
MQIGIPKPSQRLDEVYFGSFAAWCEARGTCRVENTLQQNKKIWSEPQFFSKLKFIDLSHSEDLIESPIVSGVPCLEILLLEGCINLVEVHQSVGQHKKLLLLNLKDCINLQTLPTNFEMDSLEELILSGCSKVKKLPNFGKNMQCLSLLNLEKCKNLLCLPKSICNLKSLGKLSICGCSKFSTLPNSMNENGSLEELDVSGTCIREITSSNVCLENLKELCFGGWKEHASNSSWNLHQCIPMFRWQLVPKELILPPLSRLTSLKFLNLSYCDLNDESIPDDLGSLSSLLGLDLSGNYFVSPPTHCMSNLYTLQSLTLIDCPRLESLPMLPPSVQCLHTTNSTQTRPLNSDAYMLWKIFESRMNQAYFLYTPHSLPPLPPTHPNYFHKVCVYQMEDRPHFLFVIPGKEIQKWNEECFVIDPSHHPYNMLGSDLVASIIVDVPSYCGSSGWLGIVICLALEPSNMQHSSPTHSMGNEETCIYYWAGKAPDGEPDLTFPIVPKFSHFVYECNEEKCLLQLIFYVENHSKPLKPTIRKLGCRVIFKEDVEDWWKHSSGPSTSTN